MEYRKEVVGYSAIHKWVGKRLFKPSSCPKCRSIGRLDLSNNSKNYLRDLNDWEWLCHKCHGVKDGWIKNLRSGQMKGRTPWNKGKVMSDETRRKLSESHKGQHHSGSFKPGNKPWIAGRKMSDEHKRKIGEANRIALKAYYAKV